MKRLAWVLVAAMAAVASADPDADVAALAERLGSADPEVRQKAVPDLEALADSAPERLLPLLEHKDPEVAAAVRSVLEPRAVFAEKEKTERCRFLFKQLSDTLPGATGRRQIVEELLGMGGPAVARLALELETAPNCQAMPAPTKVIAAGGKVKVALQARNAGRLAFWWRPESRGIYSFCEPFGRRPLTGRGGGGRAGFRTGCGGKGDLTPEELVIRSVTALARVPAGAIFDLAEDSLLATRRGVYHLSITTTASSPSEVPEGDFSGHRVRVDPKDLDARPVADLAALSESPLAGYRARVIRNDAGRWALEVTALEDHAAPAERFGYDAFWWAAEGEGGLLRGYGSLRDEAVADAAWKKDEVRVLPLPHDVPEGTTRLWFGFDEKQDGPQLIPAPVTVR